MIKSTIMWCFVILQCATVYSADNLNKGILSTSPHNNPFADRNVEFISVSDEPLNKDHLDWLLQNSNKPVPKRSLEELNDLNGENFDEDNNILNIPIHALDRETLENSPWMKYLVIRKENKRNREYNPRLGRRSSAGGLNSGLVAAADEDDIQQRSGPPFAPRLGKKSLQFSPRLGRSYYNGEW